MTVSLHSRYYIILSVAHVSLIMWTAHVLCKRSSNYSESKAIIVKIVLTDVTRTSVICIINIDESGGISFHNNKKFLRLSWGQDIVAGTRDGFREDLKQCKG